jgi:anti-anti-sigma factor
MAITWQPFEVCTGGDLTLVRLTLRQLTYDAVCDDIMESLAELWASGAAVRVILDLASLESISSAGLAGLVMLRRRITALGGDLRLRGLRRRVREMSHVTKLDTLFCIMGAEEAGG